MNDNKTIFIRRLIPIFLSILMAAVFVGCSSKTPCKKCGNTPTKAYKNDNSGEKEYYCENCSSSCVLCHKEAKHHYTSALGVTFVCDSCWEFVQSLSGGN